MPRRVLIVSLIAALLYLPTIPSVAGAPEITPEEQWFIYDLNRARSDPAGYAAEHGMNLTKDLAPQPPLAVNLDLSESSGFKAYEWGTFYSYPGGLPTSHCSPLTGICPDELAWNYGYRHPWGTNDGNSIEGVWASNGISHPSAAAFINSPAHQAFMFEWYRTEIGAGLAHVDDGGGWDSYFAVHIAERANGLPHTFVTGVVYDDINANCIMDLGEGLSGVSVSIPGAGSTTTNAGGGYSVPVSPNSTYQVSVSGAGVSASASAVVGTDNVGLDFIKGEVTAVPPGCVERWWGSNRYETAVAVSKATYPSGAEVVYVASGWNFPDALAAGAAAAAENAPILLVHKNLIPPETETELQRLGPSTVVILGGTAAIDQSVATQIGNLTGATIDRRWGPTRYETAAEISERAFPQGANTVFVATGTDFPDALAAAPGAVAAGSPLLLVPTTGIPPAVQVELVRLNPKKIEVIGSPSAIPDWLLGDLGGYATQGADRTYGSDRYTTSVEVSKMTFPNGANTVLIAVGAKFPDALAGGAATGVFPGPILLVQENAIPWVVSAELDRLGPDRIVVLGGPAAVSSLVASQLAIYLD